jgi:hypothetical protein
MTWYTKAADAGFADALLNLGFMYEKGFGVPQDYAMAMTWYRKAANGGVVNAQLNLGVMYANGRGVPQDYATAVTWYRKAADQGLAGAQINLAIMYWNGLGVPQDYPEAYKWLEIAATRSPASENVSRGKALRARDQIAENLTPAQIAEAQKRAREWASINPNVIQGHGAQLPSGDQLGALIPSPPNSVADKTLIEQFANYYLPIARTFGCKKFAWGSFVRNHELIQLEYVPESDDVVSWTRMITITLYPPPKETASQIEAMRKY